MRMWDMELLTAQRINPTTEPTTEGLLSWADFSDPITITRFYEKTNYGTLGTITDRATGENLTFSHNVGSIYFEQENNFLNLYTEDVFSRNKILSPSTPIQNCVVLEFVFADESYKDSQRWCPYFSDHFCQYYSRDKFRADSLLGWGRGDLQSPLIGTDVPVHILYQFKDGYLDGYVNGTQLKHTQVNKNNFETTVLFSVSRQLKNGESNPTLPLRIGSIRLYERPLTDEEIQKNLQYEISMGRLSL